MPVPAAVATELTDDERVRGRSRFAEHRLDGLSEEPRPGRWRQRVRNLVVALAATLGLVGVASPAALAISGSVSPKVGPYETDLTFTNPFAYSNHQDPNILNQMARLIENTPAGQTIYLATTVFHTPTVRGAIDQALAKGVHVYVVHNGKDTGSNLAGASGIQHHWCHSDRTIGNVASKAGGGACISTSTSGIMHDKYMLISATTDRYGTLQPWVVWFGSANQNTHTGTETFNNSVAVYGDQTLYNDFYSHIWTPMWNQTSFPNNEFYHNGGYFNDAGSLITAYPSPTQQGDIVASRLGYINPDNSGNCQVRVMESFIHNNRSAVVDQLDRVRDGGCLVYVVATKINNAALCTLHDHGVHVRQVDQVTAPDGNTTGIHDKTILIHSKYNGSSSYQDHVITGSHNLSKSALRYNDELLIKIGRNPSVYGYYQQHFHDAYTDHAHGYPCGSGT